MELFVVSICLLESKRHTKIRVTTTFHTISLPGGFKHFLFLPLSGEIIQFDEHIFQMGWFNHQLVPYLNLIFWCAKSQKTVANNLQRLIFSKSPNFVTSQRAKMGSSRCLTLCCFAFFFGFRKVSLAENKRSITCITSPEVEFLKGLWWPPNSWCSIITAKNFEFVKPLTVHGLNTLVDSLL